MSVLSRIFGDANKRVITKLEPLVEEISAFEPKLEKLSAEELKNKTLEFKKRLAEGVSLDALLSEAFAVAREASKRTLGQRHFDVQMLGGAVLHQGKIAEMKTGEGKTLVATLPAYLNALLGKGVHIITVNDYLSRRDAVWMGQIYHALGLAVGVLNHEASFLYDPTHETVKEEDAARDTQGSFKIIHEFLRPCSRREAYAADITYGTNNEYGFDYLRDNMAYLPEHLTQRGYNFAIVDEVDSILIDEARTPLIISAPDEESGELYRTFSKIAPRLEAVKDYAVDEKMRAVSITEEGIEKVEKLLGVENIYTEKGIKYVHHLEQALRAQALFRRDKDYVVREGEVIIVDEFTGRLMPGRRWSDGLHQAIEAKEGVLVQKESRTLATITFQNYFRMYGKLAGMTGTASTSAEEFHKVYNLDVVEVPTNKPMVRADHPDRVYQNEVGKLKAVAREVRERHERGQPVLVGTVSIEKNERLSEMLKREGVRHEILNAKNHEQEAQIIAQAGRKGRVTLATNIAGRGVDIIFGGNPPSPEEAKEVREAGGLFVLGTERHEARRIDNQLRGRSGRQGDPGETQFFVSLEDELMRIFGSDRIKNMMGKFGIPEDEPIEAKLVSRAIESAQEKIEGFNFDARKHILEYDDVMNKQRKAIYDRRRKILFALNEEVSGIAKENLTENVSEDVLKDKEPNLLRQLLLQTIDMLWIEHLEAMEYMRSSVRLRAYGQRDPLIEYKNEAIRLFRGLEASIKLQFSHLAAHINAPLASTPQQHELKLSRDESKVSAPASSKKIGRNDPCYCGSGKKYKRCHGA
ncbi:MAG: preprotein translocase subunit SecA [bacterium]|nr:preprotein translocase subunit SecA [bacterium]